ncbi:MAG: polysaccharide biosynthesis protein [Proteobacteria bacterium]|nr:polysaccharide biosynthesis protein [Pseudomonadota bacterium]
MIPLAWFMAYWLRFNLGHIPDPPYLRALAVLPWVVLLQMSIYALFNQYRGVWRFASLSDLTRVIKVVSVGTTVIGAVLFLGPGVQGIPRSVWPLYAVLLIAFWGASRFVCRWFWESKKTLGETKKVLIVGAGKAGELLLRELLHHPENQYELLGFVDDDPIKKGREVHGIRVMGQCQDIPKLVSEQGIELVLIAIPSANSAGMRRIVSFCEQSGVTFRTLPGLNALASGKVSASSIRQVSLEDLLGRDQVELDWERIHQHLCNKKVLITGGGGSIGSELCRQVAELKPKELIVVDHSEHNFYLLEQEILQKYPDLNFKAYLCSVTDRTMIRTIMQTHQPEIVFHAAAYKHVPILQQQLRSAVYNNVIGTKIVAEEAVQENVEIFVLISTDKAVNPSNIMGATKRVAEIFCQNLNAEASTRFITVRFGNVLGSAGSVVPLFQRQIAAGGPITVTHPETTRFFMTIPEASQLILQASVLGQGGEIFVLDMGEPVKIRYLAEQLIYLSGFTQVEDIGIEYIGLRSGEKIHETLFHEQEELLPTAHSKIQLAQSRQWDWVSLNAILKEMIQCCESQDEHRAYALLMQLVPECHMESDYYFDRVVAKEPVA